MAEYALTQELLGSKGGCSVPYYYSLAQFQLLKGDYSSAIDNLKEALFYNSQVRPHFLSIDLRQKDHYHVVSM